ncbi:MAG: hypothetical protein ACFFD4_30990 [Candidatus Odinarchaeota archaeon]
MKYIQITQLRVVEEDHFNRDENDNPRTVEEIIDLERFRELYCFDSQSSFQYHLNALQKDLKTGECIGHWRYMRAYVHVPDKLRLIKQHINGEDYTEDMLYWFLNFINSKLNRENEVICKENQDLDSLRQLVFSALEQLPDQILWYLIAEHLHIR